MRKAMAIFVLAIFLISLMPMAFAAEKANARDVEKRIAAATIKAARQTNLSTEELKERLTDKFEDIREHQKEQLLIAVEKCRNLSEDKNLSAEKCDEKYEKRINLVEKLGEKDLERLDKILENKAKHEAEFEKLKNSSEFKQYKAKYTYKARVIAKEKLENAKDRFANAKEKYSEAREKYKDARLKFNETKEKLAECKNSNSTECIQLRETIILQSKEQLLKTADVMIEHLNKIKAKINSGEDLSDEEAADLIAKIDAQIGEIEAIKAKIEAAKTKEEITAAAKELKAKWALIKGWAEIYAGRVVNSRIGGIIVKSKQLETKLNSILEKMAEKGKNTSEIEPLIADFNSKLDEARNHYNLSLETFKEAKSTTPPDTDLIREAQSHMKEAEKSLQDAQKILKEITSTIKQSGGETELEESEEEVEVEKELEEEEETKIEISGDVILSTEAQTTLDKLKASFAGVEGKIELKLKVKKKEGEATIEKEQIEGTLTDEQQALWDSLKEQAIALVESAEGDDLELEIEIEHKLEAKEESEEETEEAE